MVNAADGSPSTEPEMTGVNRLVVASRREYAVPGFIRIPPLINRPHPVMLNVNER